MLERVDQALDELESTTVALALVLQELHGEAVDPWSAAQVLGVLHTIGRAEDDLLELRSRLERRAGGS